MARSWVLDLSGGVRTGASPYTYGMPDKLDRDEPVSLAPLDPEEALRALLAGRPPPVQSDRGKASEDPATEGSGE